MPFLAHWVVTCVNLTLANGWRRAERGSWGKQERRGDKGRREEKIKDEKKREEKV